jgi:hypothetical protein
MKACQACGGELIDIRGKMVCTRCFTINETCCDGGQCHTQPDPEQSPNYKESDDECF